MIASILATLSLTGCLSQKKAIYTAGGAGIGGGLAYALFDKNPLATGAGAAIGAVVTSYAYGEDEEALIASYGEGYIKSASDSLKRQYWLRQEMQKQQESGTMAYYSVPGETFTQDGRLLVDHTVTIPILE